MKALFLALVNNSLTAGYVALAVLALRLLLRRAPKWSHCLLWALVAVRLLCPVFPQSPVSLVPAAPALTTETIRQLAPAPQPAQPLPGEAETPPLPIQPTAAPHPAAPVPTTLPAPDLMLLAARVWAAGVALLLGYAVFSYLRLWLRVRTATPLAGEPGAWQSEAVTSPFILGVVRPRILLPYRLSGPALACVLAHERAHLARRDHWTKPLAFLLVSIYWFHPLLWMAYFLLCRDIELACDEHVVRDWDADRRRVYAMALVQSAAGGSRLAAGPLAFAEDDVTRRVVHVKGFRRPALWVAVLAAAVCAVAALCFLTNRPAETGTEQTTTFTAPDGRSYTLSAVLPKGCAFAAADGRDDPDGTATAVLVRGKTTIGTVHWYPLGEDSEALAAQVRPAESALPTPIFSAHAGYEDYTVRTSGGTFAAATAQYLYTLQEGSASSAVWQRVPCLLAYDWSVCPYYVELRLEPDALTEDAQAALAESLSLRGAPSAAVRPGGTEAVSGPKPTAAVSETASGTENAQRPLAAAVCDPLSSNSNAYCYTEDAATLATLAAHCEQLLQQGEAVASLEPDRGAVRSVTLYYGDGTSLNLLLLPSRFYVSTSCCTAPDYAAVYEAVDAVYQTLLSDPVTPRLGQYDPPAATGRQYLLVRRDDASGLVAARQLSSPMGYTLLYTDAETHWFSDGALELHDPATGDCGLRIELVAEGAAAEAEAAALLKRYLPGGDSILGSGARYNKLDAALTNSDPGSPCAVPVGADGCAALAVTEGPGRYSYYTRQCRRLYHITARFDLPGAELWQATLNSLRFTETEAEAAPSAISGDDPTSLGLTVYPVSDSAAVITRTPGTNADGTLYPGTDIRVAAGTSVLAMGDGTVVLACRDGGDRADLIASGLADILGFNGEDGYDGPLAEDGYAVEMFAGYGDLVLLYHDDGLYTLYAHCSGVQVTPHQKVKAGQTIATTGGDGCECHVQVIRRRAGEQRVYYGVYYPAPVIDMPAPTPARKHHPDAHH